MKREVSGASVSWGESLHVWGSARQGVRRVCTGSSVPAMGILPVSVQKVRSCHHIWPAVRTSGSACPEPSACPQPPTVATLVLPSWITALQQPASSHGKRRGRGGRRRAAPGPAPPAAPRHGRAEGAPCRPSAAGARARAGKADGTGGIPEGRKWIGSTFKLKKKTNNPQNQPRTKTQGGCCGRARWERKQER